jgi:hypothetical protein
MNKEFPEVPEELLTALERHFTHPVRGVDVSPHRLYADIGRQEVIAFLRSHFISQTKKDDEPDVHVFQA